MSKQSTLENLADVDDVEIPENLELEQPYVIPYNKDEPIVTRKELWSYYCTLSRSYILL